MRKIVVVTGTRAEYGILKPLMSKLGEQLNLIVCGMHLCHEFGHTVDEIDFPIKAQVRALVTGDTPMAMAQSVGLGITEFAQIWQQVEPDIVVILGDRPEMLAATISAAYMNIPVAHIQGGDLTGNIDDSARHAITKFAHIHFPATHDAELRILSMGEEKWRVHNVGSIVLDGLVASGEFKLPMIIVVQHPVSSQASEAGKQMEITLEAVMSFNETVFVIYPNSDAGGQAIIDVIKRYEKKVSAIKSLPRKEFLVLLDSASVLVGNSSTGIIEAPSLGLPAVNIGIRQEGRERGRNVLDVDHDKQEIIAAIKKSVEDVIFRAEVAKCENPYGDGKASERIALILNELEITPKLLLKKWGNNVEIQELATSNV